MLKTIVMCFLIIQIVFAQTTITQVQDQDNKGKQQLQTDLIKGYNKESLVGVIIVAILLILAYILGKTGHNFIYNQVENHLTQNRQIEEENTVSDEVEIQKQIQLHPPQPESQQQSSTTTNVFQNIKFKVKQQIMAIQQTISKFNMIFIKKKSNNIETAQLTNHVDMYNQFDFEDSI